MRNTIPKSISAILLSACIILMNVLTVFAADTNIPIYIMVEESAQATAKYVLSITDFEDLSDASKFHTASRNLILAIRSGADCKNELEKYISAAKLCIGTDGTLNVSADSGFENDVYSSYAYLLTVLALANEDATNFNGHNIVETFNNILKDAKKEDLIGSADGTTYVTSGKLNPYLLGVIYTAAYSYRKQMKDSETILATIKAAVNAISVKDKGVDYYGFSADNNGSVYPQFSSLYNDDSEFKSLVDGSIKYIEDNYYDETTGAVVAWGAASPDSTGLALALYAQYGNTQKAIASYNALSAFKSTENEGGYTSPYGGDEFTSQQVLIGLVTYKCALSNEANPYDVSSEVKGILGDTDSAAQLPNSPENGNINLTIIIFATIVAAAILVALILLLIKKRTKKA